MEFSAFLSMVMPLPLLFAFLAGILFLQRTSISFPFIRGRFVRTEKNTAEDFGSVALASSPSPTPHSVSKESEFPDSWWTGRSIWELERRSIFSKSWLYITHLSRFKKPGDYQSTTLAGYPIFLILGKDRKIRAFHNVCRHRAYTVTRRESGSSLVLGCRYHGWSYNASGALVKAPHFEDVPGFDKTQNGLFEIQTGISECGFVFVKLQSQSGERERGGRGRGKSFLSEEGLGGLDVFVKNSRINRNLLGGGSPDTSSFSSSSSSRLVWTGGKILEGRFNWKFGLRSNFLADSTKLEQCVPAQASASTLLESFMAMFKSSSCLNTDADGTRSSGFSLFPSTSFHAIQGTKWLYSLSLFPDSEQKTLVRYDLFCWQPKTAAVVDSSAEYISALLSEQLEGRIRQLEEDFEFLLHPEKPTSRPPDFHSSHEGADSKTQTTILEHIQVHARLEKTQGTEIYPAMRRPMVTQRFLQADMLCRDLNSCQDHNNTISKPTKDTLVW